MNPRLLKISKTRYSWSNATSNVTATPLRYFYPETAEDIQAIVSEAEHEKLRVRAVGSGHSFSEAAKGNDFLMDMKNIRDAIRYPTNLTKPVFHNNHLVLADAGITIRRLNRILDSMNLALENMGAVDFQTVSGALMTGTHGTGIAKPAFPDMIRSLRLVGTGSELIQIEPTNGITDPSAHVQQTPSIRLIQDDDLFYSTVLSFGGMGIVYQMVMEVVPRYWIKERRYLQGWSSLKADLLSGDFMQLVRDNDFVAFRANPYKIKGDHLCSVVVQNITHTPPSKFEQGKRNFISGLLSNREAIIESLVKTVNKNPKNIGKRIQTSLKFSRVKNYTDKSHKVLYQSGSAVLRYGISSEFAFPADPQKIIAVLETIFNQTAYAIAYADRYHPSHIPVRFVMPSKAYLSSAYNRETAYIDVPTLYDTIGYEDLLTNYQNILMKQGGIPHWGKINNMLYLDHSLIHQVCPKFQTWINVRQQMDPKETFVNDFIIKMGLS